MKKFFTIIAFENDMEKMEKIFKKYKDKIDGKIERTSVRELEFEGSLYRVLYYALVMEEDDFSEIVREIDGIRTY